MDIVLQIAASLLCLFLVWRIHKVLKANPELLSRQNLSKSFYSMGILALILMGGIALLVMLLRSS